LKKILITGALGQDGIILSKKFSKLKIKTLGLVKRIKKKKIKKIKYIINDLTSKKHILKILEKFKPDIVFHLASINNSYNLIKFHNYKIDYLHNYKCSKNLIDSLIEKKIKCKFIFAGSSLMFGKRDKIANEKSRFNSKNFYEKYKIDTYKYLKNISLSNPINPTLALLFNHDSVHRKNNFLLPKLVKASINKDKNYLEKIYHLNISGDFSHAEDICHGLYQIAKNKKKIDKIILSSNKRIYINKIIEYLAKKNRLKLTKNKIKNKKNYKFLGSNKFAKKIIKFKCKKTIFNVVDDLQKNYQKRNC